MAFDLDKLERMQVFHANIGGGLPLDGPDPGCVLGHGERELAQVCLPDRPSAGPGHSRAVFVPLGRPGGRAVRAAT